MLKRIIMKYSSQYNPLTLDLFKSSFDDLNKTNRWVILGDKVPWAEVEKTYNSRLGNKYKGAGYAMMANSKATRRKGTTEERMDFKGENHSRNSKGH